jgi:tRNA wybutosine-synthesizing protein 3
MVVDEFARAKKGRLSRKDKSSIGSWDKPIAKLCEDINKSDDYYTLSSCSGRIILIKETLDKEPGLFVFRSHDKISFNDLKKEIEKAALKVDKGMIYLKQEPCVLAVSCRNLDCEQELLNKAREVGWKKSGITTTSGKFVVELFSTERMDLPVIKDGKILINDDCLKIIVDEANAKLERTWKKIEKLERVLV